jgi:hypothetical protein
MVKKELKQNKTYERMKIIYGMIGQRLLSEQDASYVMDELEKEGD